MKKILLCLCILISIQSYSQPTFAPPGAVWHYDINGLGFGGFIKIEATIDSFVLGINCRKLEMNLYKWFMIGPNQIGFSLEPLNPNFVYQNGDTVFWYTENRFRELYNFSSIPGSMWTVSDSMANGVGIGGCDSLSLVYVDSTGIENINGTNLHYLTVHPATGSPLGFDGRIYECIGSTEFLFPTYAYCDTGIIVDAPFYRLHCYEDSTLGFYNTDTSDCELYWWTLQSNEIKTLQEINIYPNPAADEIQINCSSEVISIVARNIHGGKVLESNLNPGISNFKIDISFLPQGVYMITAETKLGQFTRRFIKQ